MTTNSSHVHRWLVDSPTPGQMFVAGRCSCGAEGMWLAYAVKNELKGVWIYGKVGA